MGGPSIVERFWTGLLLSSQRGPEVLKWVAFGRRLLVGVSALFLLLGVGLTVLSTVQLGRLLEASLRARGRSAAVAAARAAFVPLSLEDGRTLRLLAAEFAVQPELAGLRVVDARGKVWAEAGGARGASEGLLLLEAPVRASPSSGSKAEAIGRVEVRMDPSGFARQRRALLGTSLAVNGAFVLALLSVGLVFIRNLTLRMQIMVDEARWVAELKRSNRELEEFAYIASHDLQSPLRKVSGFAELLRESCGGRLGPEADEYIVLITDGVRRMQRLIEDLLTYSRVGSRQLSLVEVDLAEVVREVLSDLEPQRTAAGARVETAPLPVVRADRVQMGQVFQNLLGNALKFRGKSPLVVRIQAQARQDGWSFQVADNGIGIEPRYQERIFKMFARLHSVGAYEGTGIGLAVTRKIVERHGGTIWAESRPDAGTTFHFTLRGSPSGEPLTAQGGGDAR